MQITEALAGRTVEHVVREDNGGITLSTTCGRQVTLSVSNGQIEQAAKVGVKIILPGLSAVGKKGLF